MSKTESTVVTVDNYVHAETSAHFERMALGSGLNRFGHGRHPTPLNHQNVARMNRDTIYSSALVDISQGATVTLPDSGNRYLSVAVINEENYTTAIFHEAGTYELTMEEHDTPFVALVARVLVDETDPVDLAAANTLQDQLSARAESASTYHRPDYDPISLRTTHELLQALGAGLPDASYCNGKKDAVRETRHLLASAFGWGGLPTYEVVYEASTAARPTADYELTVGNVPVGGFWSISIYNKDGYFQENEFSSYSTNKRDRGAERRRLGHHQLRRAQQRPQEFPVHHGRLELRGPPLPASPSCTEWRLALPRTRAGDVITAVMRWSRVSSARRTEGARWESGE